MDQGENRKRLSMWMAGRFRNARRARRFPPAFRTHHERKTFAKVPGLGDDNPHVGQRLRIILLRIYGMLFLWSILFCKPVLDETGLGTILSLTGIALVVVAILGRCWAIVHIGTKKSDELIQTGPYSYCRNPLYFFSTLAAFGFGLSSKSVILSIVLTLAVAVTFLQIIKKEERYLAQKFDSTYECYRMQTSSFFPRIGPNRKLTPSSPGWNFRLNFHQLLENAAILLLIPVVLAFQKVRDVFQLQVLELI